MRTRTALLPAGVLAFSAACSLTSLDGLSTGDPAATEGGTNVAESGGVDEGGASDGTSDSETGATGYRSVVLSDSPLAYFRFDDTGTTAKDETGAHDGTYKGAIAHARGAIESDPSKAAVFDGASYVDVGDALSFSGDTPFTLEAWASPVPGATDPMCLMARTFAPGGVTGTISDGYTFYADDGSNTLELARVEADVRNGLTGPAIANDRFTHVVATYDGTTVTLFVDGSPTGSAASGVKLVTTSSPLTLGAGRGGIYCFFHGALDEVALYGAALPAVRIKAHYLAGIAK